MAVAGPRTTTIGAVHPFDPRTSHLRSLTPTTGYLAPNTAKRDMPWSAGIARQIAIAALEKVPPSLAELLAADSRPR
jgi:hypothetical protein